MESVGELRDNHTYAQNDSGRLFRQSGSVLSNDDSVAEQCPFLNTASPNTPIVSKNQAIFALSMAGVLTALYGVHWYTKKSPQHTAAAAAAAAETKAKATNTRKSEKAKTKATSRRASRPRRPSTSRSSSSSVS
jgi:hypothetical protein